MSNNEEEVLPDDGEYGGVFDPAQMAKVAGEMGDDAVRLARQRAAEAERQRNAAAWRQATSRGADPGGHLYGTAGMSSEDRGRLGYHKGFTRGGIRYTQLNSVVPESVRKEQEALQFLRERTIRAKEAKRQAESAGGAYAQFAPKHLSGAVIIGSPYGSKFDRGEIAENESLWGPYGRVDGAGLGDTPRGDVIGSGGGRNRVLGVTPDDVRAMYMPKSWRENRVMAKKLRELRDSNAVSFSNAGQELADAELTFAQVSADFDPQTAKPEQIALISGAKSRLDQAQAAYDAAKAKADPKNQKRIFGYDRSGNPIIDTIAHREQVQAEREAERQRRLEILARQGKKGVGVFNESPFGHPTLDNLYNFSVAAGVSRDAVLKYLAPYYDALTKANTESDRRSIEMKIAELEAQSRENVAQIGADASITVGKGRDDAAREVAERAAQSREKAAQIGAAGAVDAVKAKGQSGLDLAQRRRDWDLEDKQSEATLRNDELLNQYDFVNRGDNGDIYRSLDPSSRSAIDKVASDTSGKFILCYDDFSGFLSAQSRSDVDDDAFRERYIPVYKLKRDEIDKLLSSNMRDFLKYVELTGRLPRIPSSKP